MPRAIAIFLLALTGAAAAQSSLPLDGYYHPGRYMPVMLHGPLPATISSPDAVPTELPETTSSNVSAIVPVLVLRPSSAPLLVRAGSGNESLALRPLSDDLLLIGYTASRPPPRSDAFPRRPMMPVRVSVDQLNPAIAWTTLDSLVLDESSFRVLPPKGLADLLASGVQILVEQDARPAGDLPWQRSGPYWQCSPPRAGPRGAMLDHAYEPTLAWKPSWPLRVRVQVVVAAVVIAAAAIILMLLRWRWAAAAACALLIVSAALAWLWHARTPPVFQAVATVIVQELQPSPLPVPEGRPGEGSDSGPLPGIAGEGARGVSSPNQSTMTSQAPSPGFRSSNFESLPSPGRDDRVIAGRGDRSIAPSPSRFDQRDLWLYQTAARGHDSALQVADFTVPMLYTPEQVREQQLRLQCSRDGSPTAFVFHLPAGQRIGFLQRRLSAGSSISEIANRGGTSLAAQLAPLYQRPGDTVQNIIAPPSRSAVDNFGTILISRPSPRPFDPSPASAPGTTGPSPAGRSGSPPPPT